MAGRMCQESRAHPLRRTPPASASRNENLGNSSGQRAGAGKASAADKASANAGYDAARARKVA